MKKDINIVINISICNKMVDNLSKDIIKALSTIDFSSLDNLSENDEINLKINKSLESNQTEIKRSLDKSSINIPKLQTENLNAAFALHEYLISNPGMTIKEMKLFINSKKRCLLKFKEPAHYKNYENIFKFLFNTNRLFKVGKHRFKYYGTP